MSVGLRCFWKMTSATCATNYGAPYRCLSLFSSSPSSSPSLLGCDKHWRIPSTRHLERKSRLKTQACSFALGYSSRGTPPQGASLAQSVFNSRQTQARMTGTSGNRKDGASVSGRTLAAASSTASNHDAVGTASASASASPRHFCDACGTLTVREIPEGDSRPRQVCPSCEKIHYINPKVVVGCLVECLAPAKKDGGKMKRHVLLCKRGIEPCRGLWTLPAGFQECEESTAEGAARETREEANAEVTIVAPYAHLDIPAISQTYFIYRATLSSPDAHSPGEETLETELYDVDSIPFDKIAFSSIKIVLQRYLEDIAKGTWGFHQGTIIKEPGVAADSPHFKLSNYMNLNTDHSSKL